MEGEIDGNAVLDFAIFDLTVAQNRFNAIVCRKGITEKVATGPLDQLALHLTEVNAFHSGGLNDSFKLEVSATLEGFSWFTKSTVSGFLYLVNAPDLLKSAHAIENEISQLEDTRKFHLSLYTKDLPELSTSALEENGDSKENGSTQKVKADTSPDLTKNELLRALDLRLMALREELSVTFSRVLGPASSSKQISDLAAFCQYFGAAEMRTLLLKYLELDAREQIPNASDQQTSAFPHEVPSNRGKTGGISFQPVSGTDTLKSVRTGNSPAKVAQAERQSSSESEDPSDSSDVDQPVAERSRPLIRSASPRRSASPMRRVQIGRSGSRRPTALTIKSLSYFPARERTYMDADGNGSGNEEPERPQNRTETNVKRMSVQDAINLFESKQRDQNSNIQSRKGFNEISASTNKSVLRRWSAGMGESSKQCSQVTSSDVALPNNSNNLVLQSEELTIQPEFDVTIAGIDKVEDIVDKALASDESVPSLISKSATDLDVPKAEETQEKSADAAEWTRQKEAELNQMLMKLMESKPLKYRNTTSGNSGNPASERKGIIHRRYNEKGDVKLQTETDRKRTEKEGQLKMMQETLDQRKTKTGSKTSGVPGKLDTSSHPQKSRRNSSPPVLSKKEMPKSAAVKKPSPKTPSPMPATRNSWSSIPSPRTAGTPPSKASATTSTKNTTSSSRKPQPMLSPSRRSPKPERSLLQSKGTKETQSEGKISSKGQDSRLQSSTASSRSSKTKLSAPSRNDSGAVSTKPTLYNKAKKSSVVPLESKPFLRKGTGSSQGVGSTVPKTLHQSDDLSRATGNLLPDEEKESVIEKAEAIFEQPKEVLVESVNSDDRKCHYPVSSDLNCEITHGVDPVVEVDNNVMKSVEIPTEECKPDEDLDISSAAWVEIDQEGTSESCDIGISQMADSEIAPLPSSSPRVRHSLSQMLQADNGEMEILEWGNAENPPALIYQKDAPKGLKRLLKFGRKSREVSLAGWSSPPVFSEGEEDTEEARTNGKRSTDAVLKKATVQTKGFGKQKTALSESYDGGYSSKRSMDHSTHDILSAQTSMNNFPSSNSHKLREGHLSTSAISGKATRSFFSLSTFRSSKSNETKLR